MLFEGLAAVFRGPPLKRVDDAQVGGNRELAPRRVPQLRGAPLGVDAVQPGDGVYEQFVARAFGEGEVESGVEIAVVLADEQAALLIAGDDLEAVKLFGCMAHGGDFRNARLHDAAVFRHFVEHQALGIHGFKDGLLERLYVGHADIRPVPLPAFEEPFFGKSTDGFADAAAGNAEGLGKGPFRGQFVPVAEMAFRHELPEAFRELLIAPARTPGGRVCFGHDAFLTELVRPI